MFRREKQAGQAMVCVAIDTTISVSLRHRDASAPTRRGLFFKSQLESLAGKAQRLGRKMSTQFSFEFPQSRIRPNRKYFNDLIGVNLPLGSPIASRQRCRFPQLATLLFDTTNP